jgi:hypothetical protein
MRASKKGAAAVKFFAKAVIALAGVTAVLVAAENAYAQAALEPGLWRLMVNSTTNGKPDPGQDSKECLGEELKDIAAYFAPQLEEAKATCTRTRQPSKDPKVVAYRMQCTGAGFTVDARSSVTIEDSRHFSLFLQIDSRSQQESATVVAKGEASWTGACPGK